MVSSKRSEETGLKLLTREEKSHSLKSKDPFKKNAYIFHKSFHIKTSREFFFVKYGCRAHTSDDKSTILILFLTIFLDLHITRGEPIEEMVAFPSVSTLLTVMKGFIWVEWEREKETFHEREKVQLGVLDTPR